MNVIPGIQYSKDRGFGDGRTFDFLVLNGPDGDGLYEVMRLGGPLHGQHFHIGADYFQDAIRAYDRRNRDHNNNVCFPALTAADLARELECPIGLIDEAHAR